MKKVAVLGSTGMLGTAVSGMSLDNHEIVEVNRSTGPVNSKNFHFQVKRNLNELEELLKTGEITHLINCIGLIRQKMEKLESHSLENAIEANVLVPLQLANLSEKYELDVIQIGTDCVFSGRTGGYVEVDRHDPIDLYGKTKSLGEIPYPRLSIIRASIIGLEKDSHKSLLSWLLSQPINAQVNGFSDQLWNGITVLQFSKLVEGMINCGKNEYFYGIHHFVPRNSLTKLEVLRSIRSAFEREDLKIEPSKSGNPLDMTLSTVNPIFNEFLWQTAGYKEVPSIEEMISEYSRSMRAQVRDE
jgi:dTDP-4-dehydrorhamnose reductase